MHSMLI